MQLQAIPLPNLKRPETPLLSHRYPSYREFAVPQAQRTTFLRR